jgi:hypothetical protein
MTQGGEYRVTASVEAKRQCGKCQKLPQEGKRPLKCTGCNRIYYCDAVCQKADWKRHRSECLAAQEQGKKE